MTRCFMVVLAALACSESRPSAPTVGKPAPAYQAVDLQGNAASLAALKGKVVLLGSWATWCYPCREEIPYLQQLHEERSKDGLAVVGVSVDAEGQETQIRDFIDEFKMTYPIWRDPAERIQTTFYAIGVPSSYLIDRKGILRWKHLGIVRATDTSFTNALERALREEAP